MKALLLVLVALLAVGCGESPTAPTPSAQPAPQPVQPPPPGPLWTHSGSGNTVFTMPNTFDRVRIRGTWNGEGTSNFIVHIGPNYVVNEILRNMPDRTYEGVHLTRGGGTVEITGSSSVQWAFTEER
jgi:hypothetical protein